MRPKEDYYLCLLGGSGNLSDHSIREMVSRGDFESFINCFMAGLSHQISRQTGEFENPIGGTMANRIKGDLRALIEQLNYEFSK